MRRKTLSIYRDSEEPEYLINWWTPSDTYPVCEVGEFFYTVYHIPTGKMDYKKVLCLQSETFYRLLNKWNKEDRISWKYWET